MIFLFRVDRFKKLLLIAVLIHFLYYRLDFNTVPLKTMSIQAESMLIIFGICNSYDFLDRGLKISMYRFCFYEANFE